MWCTVVYGLLGLSFSTIVARDAAPGVLWIPAGSHVDQLFCLVKCAFLNWADTKPL